MDEAQAKRVIGSIISNTGEHLNHGMDFLTQEEGMNAVDAAYAIGAVLKAMGENMVRQTVQHDAHAPLRGKPIDDEVARQVAQAGRLFGEPN